MKPNQRLDFARRINRRRGDASRQSNQRLAQLAAKDALRLRLALKASDSIVVQDQRLAQLAANPAITFTGCHQRTAGAFANAAAFSVENEMSCSRILPLLVELALVSGPPNLRQAE
jgi:hypothetical protein